MTAQIRCLRCSHARTISAVELDCVTRNPRSAYCSRCLSRDVKVEECPAEKK